jgi:hypothetical protein
LDHLYHRSDDAHCGDVLLRDADHGAITKKNRPSSLALIRHGLGRIPLCLYNVHHHDHLLSHEDEWGRCAAHARLPPPNVTRHVASRDQYWTSQHDSPEQSLATRQWLEFGRTHWPQWPILVEQPVVPLHTQQQRPVASAITTDMASAASVDTRAITAMWRSPNDKSLPRLQAPVVSLDSADSMDDSSTGTARPPRRVCTPRRPTLLSERRPPPRGGQIVWAATA